MDGYTIAIIVAVIVGLYSFARMFWISSVKARWESDSKKHYYGVVVTHEVTGSERYKAKRERIPKKWRDLDLFDYEGVLSGWFELWFEFWIWDYCDIFSDCELSDFVYADASYKEIDLMPYEEVPAPEPEPIPEPELESDNEDGDVPYDEDYDGNDGESDVDEPEVEPENEQIEEAIEAVENESPQQDPEPVRETYSNPVPTQPSPVPEPTPSYDLGGDSGGGYCSGGDSGGSDD